MPERDEDIEKVFPKIAGNYQITSPIDHSYNCIAFAAGDQNRFWWPMFGFWPEGIPASVELDSFRACYASLGYEDCDCDEQLENGFEKVAIFVDHLGNPTHAAKQTLNGAWKSKLGSLQDIEHTLNALEGSFYGRVAVIMKRRA